MLAGSHRAEAARFTRQVTVGLDKWRSFVEEDRSTSGLLEKAPRRIYDWWDAEMKGGFDVRHGQQGQVLRYGKSLSIPEPYDVQYELKVSLVEGLFEGFELQRLLSLCEERQGFQPSLQKDRFGQVVQDGRRTSHSCAMRWPLLGDEDEVELRYAQEATERCAAALGLKSFAGQVRSIQATPYHHLPGRKCVGCALHHLQGRQYPLLAVSSQRQRLRQLSNILRDSGAVPSTQESSWNSKDTAAAVLVTGTAIGGGFLALPYTTAPSGFVPSFVVMLFSWALLFVQDFTPCSSGYRPVGRGVKRRSSQLCSCSAEEAGQQG
eukprot:g27668.t1